MEVDAQRATGLVREGAVRVADRRAGCIGSLHSPDIRNDVKSRDQAASPTNKPGPRREGTRDNYNVWQSMDSESTHAISAKARRGGEMRERLWKTLREGMKSNYDGSKWVIGEWRTEKPPTEECHGLNACPRLISAMQYVGPEIVALVESGGKVIKGKDKLTCEKMRVVKAYKWEKKDSVALAIFSAELVLKNYESLYPGDGRPRAAIVAAKKYLEDSTEENRQAAESAESARFAADECLDQIEAWLMERVKTLEEVGGRDDTV